MGVKTIYQMIMTFVIGLCLFACSSDRHSGGEVTDRFWKVKSIDGNTLKLSNNKKIILIGVEDNQQVEAFLKSYLKTKVQFHFDTDKVPRRASKTRSFYGYVEDEDGVDLSALILKNKISVLDREYLNDSLHNYKIYAETDYSLESRSLPVDEVKAATFLVETFRGRRKIGEGSGFFVRSSGVGVSNHHVFKGGDRWRIKLCEDESTYEVGRIYAGDAELDYVVFQVKDTGTTDYLSLAEQIPNQGEPIYVYGNPKGLDCTLSQGIVSAIREQLIQIDAAISPGSSGGPVVNVKGEVIGIATMKQLECENCNFAMSIEVVRNELP